MVLWEAFRETFPKNLRFSAQSKLLHSRLVLVVQRNRSRRYIPRAELDAVVDLFAPPPYRWMASPLRRLLLLSTVSQVRHVVFKKPIWLLSRPAAEDHQRLREWLQRYTDAVKTPVPGRIAAPATARDRKQETHDKEGMDGTSSAPPPRSRWSVGKYTRSPTTKAQSSSGPASPQSPKSAAMVSSRGIAAERPDEAAPPSGSGTSSDGAADDRTFREWARAAAGREPLAHVDRAMFEKDFMAFFHVATAYHLSFVTCLAVTLLVGFLAAIALLMDPILYVYLCWYLRLGRDGVLAFFSVVEEEHLLVDVPEAYKGLLPPPAALVPASRAPPRRLPTAATNTSIGASGSVTGGASPAVEAIIDPRTGAEVAPLASDAAVAGAGAGTDGVSDVYVVNAVEMVSPDGKVSVVFVPCPLVGPESFFREVGRIMRRADLLLLEGTDVKKTHMQPASTFFSHRDPMLAAVGLSHRFYDILCSEREPPALLPAAMPMAMLTYVRMAVIPARLQMLVDPRGLMGSKGEARTGWAWLLDAIDLIRDAGLSEGPRAAGDGAPGGGSAGQGSVLAPTAREGLRDGSGSGVLVVPWTVYQIANIEASLLRQGYTITNVLPIRWMEEGQMGRAFAQYYNIPHDEAE